MIPVLMTSKMCIRDSNNISQSVAEEITGSIGLTALDSFVASARNQDTTKALSNLETLFDNGKSMSRFATDLLEYFRDLLIVKAGGENSHHSPLFEENLSLEQDRLFQLIDLVTSALPEIKTGTHPKIYAEMLTCLLYTSPEYKEAIVASFADIMKHSRTYQASKLEEK